MELRSGAQRAGQVDGVGRGLEHVAEDDVIDCAGLDAAPGKCPLRAITRGRGGEVFQGSAKVPKPVRAPDRKTTPVSGASGVMVKLLRGH